MEDAHLRHVPVRDACEASDILRHCRGADFTAFLDEAYAERARFAQADLRHLEITLLEDLEGQMAARKKDCIERKNKSPRVIDAGRRRYGIHSESSRWRTSTRLPLRKWAASFSTK